MRIIDEQTLDLFRGPGECEACFSKAWRREPHHILFRGMSSGHRLDVKINLVSLCAAFTGGSNCHDRYHNEGRLKFDGRILRRAELWEIVSLREKISFDIDLESVCYFLDRLPKDARPAQIEAAAQNLTEEERVLAYGIVLKAKAA